MANASIVACAAKWIASSLNEEGQHLHGVEDLVHSLQTDLESTLENLLKVDASPNLVKEDGRLCVFTKKMRELAFRAEDVIDTYIVDVGAKVYVKTSFFKLACLTTHSNPLHTLRKEIKAILQEIQETKNRFETHGMILSNTTTTHSQYGKSNNIESSSSCHNLPSGSYVKSLDDEVVVGIDDVVAKLANQLTNTVDDEFRVLGIVGTSGAGKTTLATQLCRHNKVASLFPHQAFVFVSQQWRRIDLLQRIFTQLTGGNDAIPSNESVLVKELYEFMKSRQCLVVLDDVWKKEAWDDICPIFPRAKKAGCRVILTTRIEQVPLHADNKCIIHEPQLLTDDQTWALFHKFTMEGRPHLENGQLGQYEMLGRQIVQKCQGLPLAIVTLAGVLRTKRELYEWEDVSKACSEYIPNGKGSLGYQVVEDMLELSYHDLPTYMKPCFLYLAIYPEGYNIEAHWLIRMWIAEGFITADLIGKGQVTLEDVGMELLNELAQRCLLHVTSRDAQGRIGTFRLHGLMRKLCLEQAEEYQFVGTIPSMYPNVSERNQPRRLAIYSRNKFPIKNRSLRTVVDFDKFADEVIIKNLEHLGRCKLLRVLMMWGGGLPKHIGKLIHLRFLAIFQTNIRELLDSVRNLRNLLFLWYVSDEEEVEVPNGLVCKMESLKELTLPSYLKRGSESFNYTFGLSVCKNLQALRSGAGTWMMKDLPTLSLTVQSLTIADIQTPEETDAIYKCPSVKEDRLSTLTCDVYNPGLEFDLRRRRHCETLQSLELYKCALTFGGLGALEFPPNLVKLCLSNNKVEERDYDLMQVLGELSNLRTLSLFNAYNGKRLSCKSGAFPRLQELEMEYLFGLEEWIVEEGAMARIAKLRINFCRRLKRLPPSIRSITSLKKLEITDMSEEFCKSHGLGGGSSRGEDCYISQHIPSVKFSCY